jgi:hypothetical protein
MKKILLILTCLWVTGCVTGQSKPDTKEFEEGDKISLPLSSTPGLNRSPFLNTQKSKIFEQNGIKIFFYYGVGGRYLIQMILPPEISLDFSKAEGTLLVDFNGNSPETLSLSTSSEGLFQGQGNIRNGKTDFRLEIQAPAYGGGIFKKELEFSISISDNLALTE